MFIIDANVLYGMSFLAFSSVIIYATLQARHIGLSFTDVGVVLGLLPFASALANPLLGNLIILSITDSSFKIFVLYNIKFPICIVQTTLGYLGDKIGLKPMVLFAMIGFGVCGTCMDLTPRYKEFYRYSTSIITTNNIAEGNFVMRSIHWPTNYPHCDNLEVQDLNMCATAPPVTNVDFYHNLIDYLICENDFGETIQVKSLDISFFESPSNNSLTVTELGNNGTFCNLYFNYINNISEEKISCVINENPEIGSCFNSSGSHAATFFTYLCLRIFFNIFISTMFALLDGTAMHLVKQHSGDYSMVLVWNFVAGVLGPLISGALVKDSDDPSGKYQIS